MRLEFHCPTASNFEHQESLTNWSQSLFQSIGLKVPDPQDLILSMQPTINHHWYCSNKTDKYSCHTSLALGGKDMHILSRGGPECILHQFIASFMESTDPNG